MISTNYRLALTKQQNFAARNQLGFGISKEEFHSLQPGDRLEVIEDIVNENDGIVDHKKGTMYGVVQVHPYTDEQRELLKSTGFALPENSLECASIDEMTRINYSAHTILRPVESWLKALKKLAPTEESLSIIIKEGVNNLLQRREAWKKFHP